MAGGAGVQQEGAALVVQRGLVGVDAGEVGADRGEVGLDAPEGAVERGDLFRGQPNLDPAGCALAGAPRPITVACISQPFMCLAINRGC